MEKEKKKINFKIIIPIVAVVIIAVVGIIVFTKGKGTEETGNKNNEELTIESVTGTYKNIGLLSNEDVIYTLNSNTSFDQTSALNSLLWKGTFSITSKNEIYLKDNATNETETFTKYKDYYYEKSSQKCFPVKKDDYGLTIELNSDTIKGQNFSAITFDVSKDVTNKGDVRYKLYLKFLENGTFELHTGYYSITKSDNAGYRKGYKGTYEVKDDIIKLKYNEENKEDTLLIIDNQIYFSVIEKQ